MIDQIGSIILWYGDNAKSATIDLIMNAKDKLVTLNYTLGETLAEAQTDFNKKYFIRKITIAKKEAYHINSGEAIGRAKIIAAEECEFQFKEELEAEAEANKYEILHRQANRVVEAMTQRISVLKREYETY